MSTVSVIIPTYDRRRFLRGAIRTAREQTYDDVEVVVVDDGSPEAYAEEICSAYDDVRLVTHEENRGLSAARNTGIDHSEGEYVAFLDDDDRWHRTKLERQVHAMETDPDVGIVSCLVCTVTPDGELVRAETSRPDGTLRPELLVSNVVGTPSRVLVRRECVREHGGFDEELPTKQDWDFYLRLTADRMVLVLERHLCVRTLHDSMSSSPEAVERDRRRIIEKHRDEIERWGVLDRTMAEYHATVGRNYLEAGDRQAARSHLKRAMSYNASTYALLHLLFAYGPRPAFEAAVDLKQRSERSVNRPTDSIDRIPGLHS